MQIYDVTQVGEMLRVAPKTVRSYLRTGSLIGRKVGRRWLVAEDALLQFLMEPEDGTNSGDDVLAGPVNTPDMQW